MFNSVNNPFGKKIESALSAGQDKKQREQQKKEEEEKHYLEEDESDEVKIGGRPILTEDDVLYLVKEYINKLISENIENEKITSKLNKFMEKFDVKRFMKRNPNMTSSDFYMVMYNETSGLLN